MLHILKKLLFGVYAKLFYLIEKKEHQDIIVLTFGEPSSINLHVSEKL